MIIFLILIKVVSSQILEGKVVWPSNDRWNFMVSIHFDFVFVCGGAAITKNFVITANHCLDGEMEVDAQILADSKLSVISRMNQGNLHNVSRFFRHYEDDLALIKLKGELTETIKLQRNTQILSRNTVCRYAGWGIYENQTLDSSHEEKSDFLLEVTTVYKGRANSNPDELWTQDEGFMRSRAGDSGAPLICPIRGREYLVGVLSKNIESGYTRFTDVYVHLGWIKDVIKHNGGLALSVLMA